MHKTTLEQIQITKDLLHIIFVSHSGENICLHVSYKNGRFVIEKTFNNNYFGLKDLKAAREKFSTEQSVIDYLQIGEIK